MKEEALVPATTIHPTADIDPSADLETGVTIGAGAIVEARAHIGAGTFIGPRAFVGADTVLGRDCRLFLGAVVGSEPQDLKYKGERTHLRIGDRTVIREYATVNRATGEGEETLIGSDCLLMSYAHVGHNCIIGNHAILAGPCALAGHIEVHPFAIIGGMCAVHQFTKIGMHTILGGMSATRQDLVPFIKASDTPARPYGINTVGLERRGFDKDRIKRLNTIYRIVFHAGLALDNAIAKIEAEFPGDPDMQVMADFLKNSERGISRPR